MRRGCATSIISRDSTRRSPPLPRRRPCSPTLAAAPQASAKATAERNTKAERTATELEKAHAAHAAELQAERERSAAGAGELGAELAQLKKDE